MQICPECGSKRIGHFRLDSDWGDGGDWYAQNEQANNEAEYTELDMESFRRNGRPDVECCVCCQCSTCFEPKAANVHDESESWGDYRGNPRTLREAGIMTEKNIFDNRAVAVLLLSVGIILLVWVLL